MVREDGERLVLLLIQKLQLGQGDLLRLVRLGFGLHLLLTFLLHPLVDANGFRIACGGPGGLLTHPSILDNLASGVVLLSDQNCLAPTTTVWEAE
jgi:hypothetical protein